MTKAEKAQDKAKRFQDFVDFAIQDGHLDEIGNVDAFLVAALETFLDLDAEQE